jgi:fumarate hydratase subunit alpha
MREIHSNEITNAVRELCIKANSFLPKDIENSLKKSFEDEKFEIAKDTLMKLIENSSIASSEKVPICQDTGMACVFLEIGQDVHISGQFIDDAINEGVKQGYEEGYLRKSIVKDPINRINTKDNTPAAITYEFVPGENIKITVAPKGFGSENMSKIKMLKPADGIEGVKKFITDTVKEAGPNPCPPMVIGVGIGGNFDKVAALAKKALLRPIDEYNSDDFYKNLEEEMLVKINQLGIGPQGFGGKTTALGVNIETLPTHIAGLPVAVNISCHVTRHASCII